MSLVGRLALPARCPGCGVVVADAHRFCALCWGGMRFLGPPWCAGCNKPFEYDRGEGALCAICIADPPRHAGVFAAVAYDRISRQLALDLKYGRRIGLGDTMARYMQRLVPTTVDLVLPVPLHRWRLWTRGFNQSVVIGAALARGAELPLDRVALMRTRATPSLRGRGIAARARAVRSAFAVVDHRRVAGRRIALVDDIYTTGATAAAATSVLLRAGATSVAILCWARVLGDEDHPWSD